MSAREFTYAIALDRTGIITAGGEAPLELDPAWTPEHLTLAGLVRCTLESLRYHADRIGVDYLASASADARVTKREDDGRYAFVEIDVRIELELEPVPDDLRELLDSAERDCFVGASLRPAPRYRWRVNDRDV
ncbi:MAG: OsmC family protein [Gaiellaceae bacterium]